MRLHPPGSYESQAFAAAGGQQGGYVVTPLPEARNHPAVWDGMAGGWVSLLPNPTANGQLFGMSEQAQVVIVNGHAALWRGTAASFVDLHPSGSFESEAHAVSGDIQAGEASFVGLGRRAALWHGTASSFVDLTPVGADYSFATATDGVHVGGVASVPDPVFGHVPHAALWSGSAASFIDLTPGTQITSSGINGMSLDQQVGYTVGTHAVLWRGTPESRIDLNPGPTAYSEAYATCGTAQVGYVGGPLTGIGITAAIWFGTPESWIPLGGLLPPGYDESIATAVSFHDGQYYVAGYAYNLSTGHNEAFLWVGVPAPSSLALLGAPGLLAARRRRVLRER